MNGNATGAQWGLLGVVWAGLFLFGCLFNAFVGWAQHQGYDEGLTALEVVLGVLVTVLGASLALWGRVYNAGSLLTLLTCFVASGSPMILGALARYALLRAKGQAAQRDRS